MPGQDIESDEADKQRPCRAADGTQARQTSTIWRPIISSLWLARREQLKMLKAEDVVCFYHKEAERYLDFDPLRVEDRPQLKPSRRVSPPFVRV